MRTELRSPVGLFRGHRGEETSYCPPSWHQRPQVFSAYPLRAHLYGFKSDTSRPCGWPQAFLVIGQIVPQVRILPQLASHGCSTKTRLGQDTVGLNSFPTMKGRTQHTGMLRTLGAERCPPCSFSLLSRLVVPRYLQAIPEAPGLLFLPGSPSLLYCHLGLLLPAWKRRSEESVKRSVLPWGLGG